MVCSVEESGGGEMCYLLGMPAGELDGFCLSVYDDDDNLEQSVCDFADEDGDGYYAVTVCYTIPPDWTESCEIM